MSNILFSKSTWSIKANFCIENAWVGGGGGGGGRGGGGESLYAASWSPGQLDSFSPISNIKKRIMQYELSHIENSA